LRSIFGEDKTVLRGGYRIAYDPAFYNIFSNMATAAPVVNLGSLSNVALPASGTGAGAQSAYFPLIPRGANPGARSQTRVTNDFHNPYTEQWSFGIERTVNSKVAFESRYVGNHTVGNFTTINGNPRLDLLPSSILPTGVKPCTTAGTPGLGREDCDFSLLRVRNNGAFSIYHGLQNQVNLRNWHNFTANVAYTWSKAIDNVSEIFQSDAGIGTPIAQNPFDTTNGERGVSAQSFPHVVTSYWIYELPWMKSQQGILGKVLGGYQIGGTYRYQTGAPFTPYQAAGFNTACDSTFSATFIGVENCRPILANPNAPFDQVGSYSKNATTGVVTLQNNSTGLPTTTNDVHFIINSQLADSILCNGNPFACTVSRNTFRSQSRNQLDMSVQKGLKFGERINLQLRADMFNVTNYMFRGLPDPEVDDVNVANAGTFGGNLFRTSGRRFMQLSAHITF
ncbi:MAG: hypothetical protein ACJ72H_10215, partial [Candidatus Sulfotelmatobacter sp.]